ncbi:hypothetical protein QE152_g26050 [Popillia japonica]|uniref:Uncharacterized protein n=1 Tax=Popillia japonica TaxID=7064 RepID=A0AAW1JZJ5_POPJA
MPNTRPTRRSTRNTQHDEVRRNTRRSLSEPRQPTEPKTETIANADTFDLSTYFEAEWDDKAIQLIEAKRKQTLLTEFSKLENLIEAKRKQTLLTLFSKLENLLINNLNLMKADIGILKAQVGEIRSDINADMNQLKTEIITVCQNMLRQNLDDLIHHKIKKTLARHCE